MSVQEATPMEVDCQECAFSRVVEPTTEELPADVVIEHGRSSGHKLRVGEIEN